MFEGILEQTIGKSISWLCSINVTKQSLKLGARCSASCVWSLTLLMQASLATVKLAVLLVSIRVFESPRLL
jgi:hypothetical protein